MTDLLALAYVAMGMLTVGLAAYSIDDFKEDGTLTVLACSFAAWPFFLPMIIGAMLGEKRRARSNSISQGSDQP